MKESDIQKQIMDYLDLKRVFYYRNNTGAFAGEYNGKKRFIRFGALGSPDLVCVIDGRYVGIEVKNKNNVQSTAQHNFQVALEEAGGKYVLARCLEDVIKII